MTLGGANPITQRPAARPGLLAVDIDDDRVVWDPVRRQVHRLNRSASAIWALCDGERTSSEIAALLEQDFGTDHVRMRADVQVLIDELKAEHLLDDGESITPQPDPAVPLPRVGAAAATARSLVADRGWSSTNGPFSAFDFTFDLCTDDEELGAFLGGALSGLTNTAAAEHRYSIRRTRGSSQRTVLSLDGTPLMRSARPSRVADYLFWHLNRMTIRSVHRRVLIHSGAVTIDGVVVVMAAASGSGKSTLTTGLCLGSANYLSDECVALDPATGIAWPYPKPITLERGVWHLFPDLAPRSAIERELSDREWQIGAERLAGGVGSPGVPGVIVFPRYRAGLPTEVARMAPVDALIELLRHTFAFDELGAVGLDTLASLVTSVPCHLLHVGDLAGGVDAVNRLVAAP